MMDPDCRDGKHASCSGDGWDTDADQPQPCPCTCHASGDATAQVIAEVAAERERQKAKWGEQNHPDGTGPDKLPMPYGSGSWGAAVAAERLTLLTNCAAQIGQVTWLHILREEVFEAFAEKDPTKLRAELIQVAAVAAQWAEAIDRAKQQP